MTSSRLDLDLALIGFSVLLGAGFRGPHSLHTRPKRFALHLIVDNSSTHSTPAVKEWLAAHPRFTLHFTPTSSSWLNLVERWFAELTRRRLKRGTFASVPELVRAIEEHIALNNAHPKPFEWHASAELILSKVARCKEALDTAH